MEEWKEYQLGDVCSRLSSGKNISASKISGSDVYPVFGGNGLRGYTDNSNFTGECAIIGRQGAFCGNVRFFSGEAYMTEHAVVVCRNEKANTRYLSYLLSTMNLGRLSGQSAQPGLAVGTLAKQLIKLPPLPTQQKIAAILSSLDDKIELNNKINTNLEQQAQALFKNWFVDFEPFGGKMPEGWKEKTLDTFCNIFTGRKNANASVENGKYKFFTCSPNVLPIDSYIFDGDAIIISGNGAYTGRTRFYSGKFDLYQRTYACTIKEDQNPDYIFILYWIIKFVLSKKIMGGTHGSAIPYIVMDDIAKFVINYDEKVFDDLSKIMKSYILQIQENENQNEKLAELRDSLLPKLMNGEIEVNGIVL